MILTVLDGQIHLCYFKYAECVEQVSTNYMNIKSNNKIHQYFSNFLVELSSLLVQSKADLFVKLLNNIKESSFFNRMVQRAVMMCDAVGLSKQSHFSFHVELSGQ